MGRGDVAASRAPPSGHSPRRDLVTPTCPECRSTDSTTPRDVLERASARETAARVAAGCLAKGLLSHLGVCVVSHVIALGDVRAEEGHRPGASDLDQVDASPVRSFDPVAEARMVAAIKAAAKDGDSLGGVVEVLAYGVPVGLGSHVHWDRKLDGLLAQALMSIQAVKAVEIGEGAEMSARRGSEAHDAIEWDADQELYLRQTARAGGIEGGMSNGGLVVAEAVDEAARHFEQAGARDGGRRHQGVEGLVQRAHRRDRGSRDGCRGRDDGGARAWRKRPCGSSEGTPWPRWCAIATPSSSTSHETPSASRHYKGDGGDGGDSAEAGG